MFAILNLLQKAKGLMGTFSSSSTNSNEATTADPFDLWINRISRLPRLLLLFGIVAMMVWPIFDPAGFVTWVTALAEMPENLWLLVFVIVGSWATTKLIRDVRSGGVEYQYQSTSEIPNTYRYDGRFENANDDDSDLPVLPPENASINQWMDNHEDR